MKRGPVSLGHRPAQAYTDQLVVLEASERSLARFARVKGRAENVLLSTLADVYCLRPGYIHSAALAMTRRTLVDRTFGVLAPALERLAPRLVIGDDELARAMLKIVRSGADRRVLDNVALGSLASASELRSPSTTS